MGIDTRKEKRLPPPDEAGGFRRIISMKLPSTIAELPWRLIAWYMAPAETIRDPERRWYGRLARLEPFVLLCLALQGTLTLALLGLMTIPLALLLLVLAGVGLRGMYKREVPREIALKRALAISVLCAAVIAFSGMSASPLLVIWLNLLMMGYPHLLHPRDSRWYITGGVAAYLSLALLPTPANPMIIVLSNLIILVAIGLVMRGLKLVTVHYFAEYQQAQVLKAELEMQRRDTLRQFISNVSHDLRTPLTSINTNLYMLRRRITIDPDKALTHVDTLEGHVKHMQDIILTMLKMMELSNSSKLKSSETVNIDFLAQQAVDHFQPLARDKSLELVLAANSQMVQVNGSQADLERALHSVIINALNFTPEGGCVDVKTYTQFKNVVIEVHDTGIGICKDDMPYIFDSFFKANRSRPTDKGGAGLGLTVAKQVIELHKGNIEIESMDGEGTTVRITLPCLVPEGVAA